MTARGTRQTSGEQLSWNKVDSSKEPAKILLPEAETLLVAYPSGLRGRSAKPLFMGSNPIATSIF